VLPYDALPGKVTGVEVVVAAVAEALSDEATVTSAARSAGVAPCTIKRWILGLGTRLLDLERLYRHRAQRAPGSTRRRRPADGPTNRPTDQPR
jgi:transposase-like protein